MSREPRKHPHYGKRSNPCVILNHYRDQVQTQNINPLLPVGGDIEYSIGVSLISTSLPRIDTTRLHTGSEYLGSIKNSLAQHYYIIISRLANYDP